MGREAAARPRTEAGGAGALVLGIVAAALLGIGLVLALTAAASAAGRAATASDLAALAAADAARGLLTGEPCAVAAETARVNGGDLLDCRRSGPSGEIVDIRTSAPFGAGWTWLGSVGATAEGRSRAGPPPRPWTGPPTGPARGRAP